MVKAMRIARLACLLTTLAAVMPLSASAAVTFEGGFFSTSSGQLTIVLDSYDYRVECDSPLVQGNTSVPLNDKATVQTWEDSSCYVYKKSEHISYATVKIAPVVITAKSATSISVPSLDVDISFPSSFGSSYVCKIHGDHDASFNASYSKNSPSGSNSWSFNSFATKYFVVNPSSVCTPPEATFKALIEGNSRFTIPQFTVTETIPPPPPTCDPLSKSRIKTGDMNGDGRADIFRFTDPGDNIGAGHVWRSEGTTYTSLGQVSTGFGRAWEDRLADWDGDADDDIFQFSENGRLDGWRSNGNTYTPLSQVGSGFPHPCEARIGDMNGDGKDDIFRFVNDGNGYVWLSTGAVASYSYKGLIGTGFGLSHQVRIVDMDGDGDDDLFKFLDNGNGYAWRSNGTSYTSLGLIATGFGSAAQVRVGDRDGDGDDDLFQFTEEGSGYYWRSNGTSYTYIGIFTSGFGPSRQVRIADINADAKSDILWFRDDGTGHAWLGDGSSWTSLGQIGTGFGVP